MRLFILSLLLLFFSNFAFAIEADKKAHLYVGIASGIPLAHFSINLENGIKQVKPNCKSTLMNTFYLGLGKEGTDAMGLGNPEFADLAYVIAGGAIACVINRTMFGTW